MTTLATPATSSAPPRPRRLAPRTVVSSLWLFAVLCYLYCDVLGFYWAEHLEEVLAGSIGGVEITQGFLLVSAVLMTIPISLVLITRIAPHRVARWGTVAGGAVMTAAQVASLSVGDVTLHYVYFSVIEIATTAFLVLYALQRWRTDDELSTGAAA
ncbi:DUF6326 family protein [Cellulomonas sp. S1-8]|uniref:DUF6326 family protein n=1 Tax=Cellulomonas sp. S1-8 TaxID=2904790 RepID=UPI0022432E69|nr:DUF6326 family protein [Cellulomonas sp. S1-8]UZN04752.1 DUF6326 family protein [Cellulomonas sp. S1-8]